jgi:hypothetical protein
MPNSRTTSCTIIAVAAGLAAATTAVGLAVLAQPAASAVDPIHVAIAAHREAARTTGLAHERPLQADDLRLADTGPMQNALTAEFRAAEAMIETAPTTQAGLGGSGRSFG